MGDELLGLLLMGLGFGSVYAIGLVRRVVDRARRTPPRRTLANTEDYYSDEVFPQVADRELGLWNRPDHHFVKYTRLASGDLLRTDVWFDRRGARVGGAEEPVPDSADLVVVGESNSWGQGLRHEQTYAAVLGRMLGMSSVNLSLIGSNGVQALLIVQRFLHLRPKVIVYGLWEEHFTSNIRRCQNVDSPVCLPRPMIRKGRSGPYVSSPRLAAYSLRKYLRWTRHTSAPGARPLPRDAYWTAHVMAREFLDENFPRTRRGSSPWPSMATGPEWAWALEASRFVLLRMKALADSVGAKLAVAYLPFYFGDAISPPPEALVSSFAQAGGLLVSLDERWSGRKREKSQFVIPEEGHLDAVGHRDVAEAVAEGLSRAGSGPAAGR